MEAGIDRPGAFTDRVPITATLHHARAIRISLRRVATRYRAEMTRKQNPPVASERASVR